MFKPLFMTALLLLSAAAGGHEPEPIAVKPAVAAVTLDWMVGDWVGEGITFGRPSRVTLTLRPIFAGRTMVMDYAVTVAAKDKIPALNFAAHAYYKISNDSRWDGRWIDNFGNFHNLSGAIKGSALTSIWGSPATEIGRTHYVLEGDVLTITDKSLSSTGNFDVFATYKLHKK